MFKFIKKLFSKSAIIKSDNKEEVWDVEDIVIAMLNIGVYNPNANHEYILPLRQKEYMCSQDYVYLRLLSVLRAFKGDREWEKYDDNDLVIHMVSENFSDDKKEKFLELLGGINQRNQFTIKTKDVFETFERRGMIIMLIEFIHAARTFENAWNKYIAFGYGGSVIWSFLNRSSFKYMNEPLEKAFKMICLLLGDDYDTPILTSELRKNYGYPVISNAELGEMEYDEIYS